MSVQSFPVLDGICPSWADVIVKASPVGAPLIEMNDIKSIDTGTSMEIGEMRGASGGRVIKRTTGSVKYEASMTLYASGFNKFLRGLLAASPPTRGNQYRLSLVHFGLQVMFTPPGTDEIFEFRIKGCRYTGRKYAASEGVDAQPVDVNLNTIEIVDMIDGKECVLL
jgi:hypothetical protein